MHDLNDCTIIIPVRFDSQDRINNLKTVLKFLNKDFTVQIIVCEHDSEQKLPTEILDEYPNVLPIFIETKDELFYKTKCINDMVKIIKTPYFALYDADVLLRTDQILQTIAKLREGYETVYPYDGTFLNVPKFYVGKLNRSVDLNSVEEPACKKGLGMPEITKDRQSFGGCVFFNTKSFVENGMANEYMISYGPEDGEIAVRFRLLTKFIRINGPIFHLDHARLLNSTEDHKMAQNNHNEFNKVLAMTKDQLIEYIKTWTWNKGI